MKYEHRNILIFFFVFWLGIVILSFFAGKQGTAFVNAKDHTLDSGEKYFIFVTVKSGDTLWGFADKYMFPGYTDREVFMDEVRRMNHLTGNLLLDGSHIIIPCYREMPD